MKRVNPFWIAILGLGFSAPSPASSDSQTRYQYVVKFVCGSSEGAEATATRVVSGRYATSVNIYNPNDTDTEFNKNLALTFPPEEQESGAVSDSIVDNLASRAALQVDCGEIPSEFSFTGGAPVSPYTEGFLVIESRGALKVTAVYAATDASGGVSVDVEEFEGSRIRVKSNGNGDQLTICHFPPGNPGNAHTIRIGSAAWPAHQSHGDTLGACK
jgi:hypothetical protein